MILKKIFKYFPTKYLLSPLSFVNKTWNREARTFIRDWRVCTARIDPWELCKHLRSLDELCAETVGDGRIFPFNSLRVNFDGCKPDEDDGENGSVYEHLSAKLRLKYVQIDCEEYNPRCPAHRQILAWIAKDKVHQLRRLEFVGVEFIKHIFDIESDPEFTQLEKIGISGGSDDTSEGKLVVGKILQNAPNLKSIDVWSTAGMQLIPEDKYELVNDLIPEPERWESDDGEFEVSSRDSDYDFECDQCYQPVYKSESAFGHFCRF